jgi:hypothetical protein
MSTAAHTCSTAACGELVTEVCWVVELAGVRGLGSCGGALWAQQKDKWMTQKCSHAELLHVVRWRLLAICWVLELAGTGAGCFVVGQLGPS